MIDALHQTVYQGGRLLGVREALLWEESDRVSALELTFEALTLTLSVDSEFDSIQATLAPMADGMIIRKAAQDVWQSCLGKGLHWAWRLTNQQGYDDGVRLEFHNPGEDTSVRAELIAMASAIDFFIANQVEA
jgi:hypothetical protein